jgi:hypothetical protein
MTQGQKCSSSRLLILYNIQLVHVRVKRKLTVLSSNINKKTTTTTTTTTHTHTHTHTHTLDVKYDNVVVLELDKTLFGFCKNVLLICVYVHPCESKYWDNVDFGYGMEILEQCIVDLYKECGDFFL